MDSFDKAFTMILAGWLAYEIFVTVKLCSLWSKEKDKAFTLNLLHIVYILIMSAAMTVSFILGHVPTVTFVLFIIGTVMSIPSLLGVFTPEKMILGNPRSNWGIKAKDISFEYTQGKVIKETLVLHVKGDDRPTKYNIGIMNPKLVTMLNDNYNKHGYSNPLLKEDK